MDKQQALNNIAQEIAVCVVCKQEKTGVAVAGEGNPDADLVFIGEAPGKQEAVSGRPFIGRSGQLLRGFIRSIGFDDEKDVYITSPVKYLPLRGTPTSADIAHGREHLMKQFQVIQPKFVVLLGRVAAEGVLQRKVAVVKDHGQVIEFGNLPAGRQVKYFLTYHPAAVLRFPNKFKASMQEDFQKVARLLKESRG